MPINLFLKIQVFSFQICWRQTVCQNRLRTASTQGDGRFSDARGAATLTERSDKTSRRLASCCQRAFRAHDTWPPDLCIEARPLVPKGFYDFLTNRNLLVQSHKEEKCSIKNFFISSDTVSLYPFMSFAACFCSAGSISKYL